MRSGVVTAWLALLVLAATGAADPVTDVLSGAERDLKAENSRTRVAAGGRRGDLADRRAVPPLLTALKDEAAEVREAAVNALADLREEIAVPHLTKVLSDSSPTVRGRALLALGKLAGKYAVRDVAAGLRDTDPGVRVCAVRALGDLGDPLMADAIRALLDATEEDEDHVLLVTAAVALTQLEGKAALDDLFRRAGDVEAFESWLVRSTFVWAVGESRDRERLPFVVRCFGASDDRVAGAAAAALVKLGEVDPVVEGLSDADPERRRLAVAALAESGDARWRDALLDRADDESVRVRLEAAVGLSRMGAPESFPSLLEGLASRETLVWGACAAELKRAYGQDFGRDQEAWVAWFKKHRERLEWDAGSRTWRVR